MRRIKESVINRAGLPDDPLPIVCMAPTNKAQAAGVSSGSFLELRAQVAKQKDSLSKGSATAAVAGNGGKKNGKVRVLNLVLYCLCAYPRRRILPSPTSHRNQVNGHFQTKASRVAPLVTWSRSASTAGRWNPRARPSSGRRKSTRS